jgi:hypothetical protein
MKTFSKVTLLLALTLAFSLFACKDEPPAEEPKIIGYITEYETNVQIPIWQTVGVPDAKAVTAKDNIIAGYNGVNNANKQSMAGKIQEIRIVNGTSATCTPTGIVEIGVDWPYDFEDIFYDTVVPAVQ